VSSVVNVFQIPNAISQQKDKRNTSALNYFKLNCPGIESIRAVLSRGEGGM